MGGGKNKKGGNNIYTQLCEINDLRAPAYGTGESTQQFLMTYMRKKNAHVSMYDSLCCTPEIHTTL